MNLDLLLAVMEKVGLGLVLTVVPLLLKLLTDWREASKASAKVHDAEREAFRTVPESFLEKTRELVDSQEVLEQRTKDLSALINRAQGALSAGLLFDVYSKQIEKYQTETQARAGWSFIFAIFAMFSGLGFVIWGGIQAVSGLGWESRAAGAAVSAIGAALSGFITKTFLDVHKLSLTQLNRYFRQPVINSHVLTAQRLADHLESPPSKEAAYLTIIDRLATLIREEDLPDWRGHASSSLPEASLHAPSRPAIKRQTAGKPKGNSPGPEAAAESV